MQNSAGIQSYVDINEVFVGKIEEKLNGLPIQAKITQAAVNRIKDSLSSSYAGGTWDGNIVIKGDPSRVIPSLYKYGRSLPKAFEKIFNKSSEDAESICKKFYQTVRDMFNSINSGTRLDKDIPELDRAIIKSADLFLDEIANIGYKKNPKVDYDVALCIGLNELANSDSKIKTILKIRKTVEQTAVVQCNYYKDKKVAEIGDRDVENLIEDIVGYLGNVLVVSGDKDELVSNLANFSKNIYDAYEALAKDSAHKVWVTGLPEYHAMMIEKNGPYINAKQSESLVCALTTGINVLVQEVVKDRYLN